MRAMNRASPDGGTPADGVPANGAASVSASSGSKYGFIAATVFSILLIVQLVASEPPVAAKAGVLEISSDSSARAPVRLDGEWEFRFGRLTRPASAEDLDHTPAGLIKVPSVWTRIRSEGRPLPAVGDATYRLAIAHPWKGIEVGVKLTRVNCAFELYADRTLIAKAGSLSDAPDGFAGGYAPQCAYFVPDSGQTVLTLIVSNRLPGAWSGAVDGLSFGPKAAIEARSTGSLVADAFNASGRLLFVVVFAALFMAYRDRLAGIFAAASLVMVVHVVTTREMLLLRLIPSIDFALFLRLQIIADLILQPFMLLSFAAFFMPNGGTPGGGSLLGKGRARSPREWINTAAVLLSVTAALSVGAAPDSYFLRLFPLFIPVEFLCFATYGIITFHDAWKKRIGPGPTGLFLLMLYYIAYEILSQARVIDQAFIRPFPLLKGLPLIGGLETAELNQGLFSYLNIAAFGFYFAYFIVKRRGAGVPLEAKRAERKASVLDDPQEIALISERVERALGDPRILGRADLDIRALSEIVKVPSYRLSIWFNSHLKTTFPEHLNMRRVRLMQTLMAKHPERTVIDIAMEAGYASKSVYNEQFRKIAGQSPSEWKRKVKGGATPPERRA